MGVKGKHFICLLKRSFWQRGVESGLERVGWVWREGWGDMTVAQVGDDAGLDWTRVC